MGVSKSSEPLGQTEARILLEAFKTTGEVSVCPDLPLFDWTGLGIPLGQPCEFTEVSIVISCPEFCQGAAPPRLRAVGSPSMNLMNLSH
jgi:hypothetical protein